MTGETWKNQYKEWKDLKPYQIRLIEEGPKSQSQAWLLNSMWCEWMDLKKSNVSETSAKEIFYGMIPENYNNRFYLFLGLLRRIVSF